MRRRLTLGQVAQILMMVALCIALWQLLIHSQRNRPFTYKRGDHIGRTIWRTIPDATRTVILVNRAECPFCTASMPFYAKLARAADDAGVEVVSVTPDDKATNQRYLESYHVHVDRIIQLKDTPLKVSGTPTLIVLDPNKTILGAWVGELSSNDEHKVLRLVRSGSP